MVTSPLDPKRVDAALRAVLSLADYDLHKQYQRDEETGEDNYHELVTEFLAAYDPRGEVTP